MLDAQRPPEGVRSSHLEHPGLELAGHLVGHELWSMRSFGERLESALFIARHPSIERLSTDAELLRRLGDGEAVSHDANYCVITLFHFADLHEHLRNVPPIKSKGRWRLRSQASPEVV